MKVDATGASGLEEVQDRAERALAGTAETAGAALLAARVEIFGLTSAHGQLVSGRERLTAEIRRLAGMVPGYPVWVEKVKLGTREPRRQSFEEGPLGTLSQVVADLRAQPAELATLVSQAIDDMRKKLPHELSEGDFGPQPEDEAWLSAVLDRAQARLEAGLLDAEEVS